MVRLPTGRHGRRSLFPNPYFEILKDTGPQVLWFLFILFSYFRLIIFCSATTSPASAPRNITWIASRVAILQFCFHRSHSFTPIHFN
jgi:hypothetical protein